MTSKFTAHNVILDDGTQTAPQFGWTMDRSPHIPVIRRMANLLFPEGMKNKRIVDLGCLEGGYTTEFARLGLDATGIEVRKTNYENCMFIKERVKLDNLHFALDDAWNLDKYGPFDIVFCAGLYYHIDAVTEFMQVLSKNCRKMLYLDTHFAPTNDDSRSVEKYWLSPMTTHEGLPGRWLPEHELETSNEALNEMRWASWENKKSFWPTRPGLLQLMYNAGFTTVFESFAELGPDLIKQMGPDGFYETRTRTAFIGLKVD